MTLHRLAAFGLAAMLAGAASGQMSYQRVRRTPGSRSAPATAVHPEVVGTFHGVLKQLDGKQIVIQNDQDQTVTFRRLRKTKFLKSGKEVKAQDIPLESRVTVDASEDVDAKPAAVSVSLDRSSRSLA